MIYGRKKDEELAPNLFDLHVVPDIKRNVLKLFLSGQDIFALYRTNKANRQIFSKIVSEYILKILSNAIITANYHLVGQIANQYPQLLFEPLPAPTLLPYSKIKEEIVNLNAVQVSIKLCDTLMWKLILETLMGKQVVFNSSQSQLLIDNQVRHPDLFSKFLQLVSVQKKDLFDFEYIFDVYVMVETQLNISRLSNPAVESAIRQLASVQKNYLPYHVLKTFCQRGLDNWDLIFNLQNPQKDNTKIVILNDQDISTELIPYSRSSCHDEDESIEHEDGSMEYNYLLVRGRGRTVAKMTEHYPLDETYTEDKENLKHLIEQHQQCLNLLPEPTLDLSLESGSHHAKK